MGYGRAASTAGLWAVFALVCAIFSTEVDGLPVNPPDLAKCKPFLRSSSEIIDCCLPTDIRVKDFQFPDPSEPVRIRKNAANLDTESIEKLNQAYLKMRALPLTDPRSMNVQQNLHCGYCTAVYTQQNSTMPLEVHYNWLLLPFHRFFVYFHERILGSLIDDPTFAIPFWNWDNSSVSHDPFPSAIPEFMYTKSGLLDVNRDPRHEPPNIIDLHFGPASSPEGTTVHDLRALNDVYMYQTVVSGSALPELFHGGAYRFGEDLVLAGSMFETGPHYSVHAWVGNGGEEDMGPPYSAARDPIFYIHHSNVDRLWRDWHALGGRRGFPSDPDFLNASFLFYDEHGDMVRVTVAQSLDLDRLRYTFEPTENSWSEDRSVALSNAKSSTPGKRFRAAKVVWSVASWLGFSSSALAFWIVDIPDMESVRAPRFSADIFHARVGRRHAAGKLDHLEEVLVIDKIWVPSKKPISFEVFLNLPGADEKTPLNATEWCGRFTNGPDLGPDLGEAAHIKREAVFSISIGEKLKKLGIADEPSVVVSLVPKGAFKHQREVQFKTVRVELR